MDAQTAALIHAVPKVELHVHLEGSIRPATLIELARRNSVMLPVDSSDELQLWLNQVGPRTFFPVFAMACSCLRTSEDFELVTYELGADLARQNVRYAEVNVSVALHRMRGVEFDTCFTGLVRGRERVRADVGVVLAWIFPVMRSPRSDPAARERAADYSVATAIEGRAGGVVALGLGGVEQDGDVGMFVPYFDRALSEGLQAAPHAGEFGGASNVAAAVDLLGAKRIAHGVRCIEDPDLVQRLAADGVCLDVCVTSNVRLGLFESYAVHPVATLRAQGVPVTVNTDDPQVFGVDLEAELGLLADEAGWSASDIRAVQLDAIRHSFMSESAKRTLEADVLAAG